MTLTVTELQVCKSARALVFLSSSGAAVPV